MWPSTETHQQIVPPEFTKNIKSVEVAEGAPLVLECHVVGIPSPTVSWFKDETNVDNSPEYVITKINGSCCLKVRQAMSTHSARYTCRAINPGGEAASSARISVIRKDSFLCTRPCSWCCAPFRHVWRSPWLNLLLSLLARDEVWMWRDASLSLLPFDLLHYCRWLNRGWNLYVSLFFCFSTAWRAMVWQRFALSCCFLLPFCFFHQP